MANFDLRIYGSSDDLVSIETIGSIEIDDELNTDSGLIQIGDMATGGVVIHMQYIENGTWAASIGRIAEDIGWPFSISVEPGGRYGKISDEGYSSLVSITDIPYSLPVKWRDFNGSKKWQTLHGAIK